ncbi:glycosyltransferase family 58 protein [Thozetella sp. PMI_491]|nr:glycosyltransferase family 58 protein [Thozetella sp. PMI_491]
MAQNQRDYSRNPIRFVLDVANGRHELSNLVPSALLFLEALACSQIIARVAYTEIDWVAYMEQIAQYQQGERDYTKIEGGTGPLVYPAAHVYIYSWLYQLTKEGKDIAMAQSLFAILYMATLTTVIACYRSAKVPPYVFPLLILSKRLHSIFMLRCFNDGIAALFLWLAIFFVQKRQWTLGAIIFSLGLGVKMSLLLVLPALGVVLFLGRGFAPALRLLVLMVNVQLALGAPFLMQNPWGYLSRAFELSRKFFFKWTVNWRFLGEDLFLDWRFHVALLVLHVTVLATFIVGKWLRPTRKPVIEMIMPFICGQPMLTEREEKEISPRITPQYILTTILTANVIGLLFARSLHYQFYAYLGWSTPFLLWRSGVHPVLQYGLWALQEWAWNVYPSTPASSGVVIGVLATTVALVWFGAGDVDLGLAEPPETVPTETTKEAPKESPREGPKASPAKKKASASKKKA